MSDSKRRSAGVPSGLREKNLKTIIDVVFRYQPISRTNIANLTGISKPTVSKLVGSLIADNCLVSTGKMSSGLGKKQELLSFNPEKAFVVSVDVGLATTIVSKIDLSMKMTNKCEIKTSKSPEQFASELVDCFSSFCDFGDAESALVVISVPGLVRNDLRTAINVPLLHWANLPLAELVERKLNLKGANCRVTINNDAKLGVLAEVALNQGIPDSYANIVYVLVKEGVGIGLFINGSLYVGSNHIAGEFGHMSINPDGPECSCGRKGCWLTVVGSRELDYLVRSNRLNDYIESFSIGLINIVNGLDPDLVVISGALEEHWDSVLPSLKSKLKSNALFDQSSVEIIKSSFDDREGPLLGGALMAFRKHLDIETGVL
ncbi:ROK family protein [Mesotoga prima]|uniref:ROK family protein n=1 Tax=Mesotoga prima TaxID=1184387 RepID=UPI002FE1E299